jgi:type VII secretion protein EccE
VVPGADTRGYADRVGNLVGLLTDGAGWTAVLQLDPIPEADLRTRLAPLLDEIAAAVEGGEIRVAATQLVGWSVPVPGGQQAPAWRVYWVAVRFVPGLHPAAVEARGGGEQGAVKSAAVAALRLAMGLRQRGYALRVLDGTELAAELSTSLGIEPPKRGLSGQPVSATGPGPVPGETWHSWSLGALHHAGFRLRHLPRDHAGLAAVLTWLARPPAITTCVSALFSRDPGGGPARTQVVLRFAVPADRDRRAVRAALRRAAAGFGTYLAPMNGEHLVGVRATIPLGRPAPDA